MKNKAIWCGNINLGPFGKIVHAIWDKIGLSQGNGKPGFVIREQSLSLIYAEKEPGSFWVICRL